MIGDGLDLNVQSQNLTGRFNWTTRLLVNYNSNKVSKYFQPVYYNIQLINGGSTLTPAVGYPLYGIASYKWAGLDAAGNPQGYLKGQKSTDYNAIMQDANTNGLASESMVYQGRTIPNFTGALINDFTSFGFTLSLNINYRFGYYFRSSGISYSTLYASGMGHAEFADRWQNPGDELHTDVPSLVYPANGNRDTFYFKASNKVDKGDHIRLQYISLAHNLPLSLLNKMGLKSLRIFSNISNLGILWRANKKGLDPEYPNALPPVKAYTIGLSARL